MKQPYVMLIIAIVLAGGAGFFGGMKYQFMIQGERGNGPGQAGIMRGQGMRPVTGEIISRDDTSITVKMEDGSSKIVVISDTTSINKSDKGSRADLLQGETVMVFGRENTDGSVTAQNVQLNPQVRRIEENEMQN